MLSNNPTQQQVIDHILEAMRKQGKGSYNQDNGCLYRGPDGTKCPVGHCIPDELYDPLMDVKDPSAGVSVESLSRRGLLKGDLTWMNEPVMLSMLKALQLSHDSFAHNMYEETFVSLFEEEVRDLCFSYQLTYKEPPSAV